jgi:phosphoglycolate phosphatase
VFGLILPLKAVIFDLDGTLINSAIPFKEMKRKVIAFLHANGVDDRLLNEDMLSAEIIDLAICYLQRKDSSENQVSEILAQLSNIMNEVELQSTGNATVIEGVPRILGVLKERGLKLGVMTRGCSEYTHKILTKFSLNRYFDAVVARDDVDQPKPNPEHAFHVLKLLGVKAQETLFIGDHWSDAECAKQAGLNFVFVSHGQGVEKVQELGYPIIENINDVVRFLA